MALLRKLADSQLFGYTVEDVVTFLVRDGLREWAKDPIPLENYTSIPFGHPKTWTRAQWEELVATCRSRKELEEATELDGKTVKRYLDARRITPPWSK